MNHVALSSRNGEVLLAIVVHVQKLTILLVGAVSPKTDDLRRMFLPDLEHLRQITHAAHENERLRMSMRTADAESHKRVRYGLQTR